MGMYLGLYEDCLLKALVKEQLDPGKDHLATAIKEIEAALKRWENPRTISEMYTSIIRRIDDYVEDQNQGYSW